VFLDCFNEFVSDDFADHVFSVVLGGVDEGGFGHGEPVFVVAVRDGDLAVFVAGPGGHVELHLVAGREALQRLAAFVQTLELAGDHQVPVLVALVERDDAYWVAGDNDFVVLAVLERKREHAAQVFEEVHALLLFEKEDGETV